MRIPVYQSKAVPTSEAPGRSLSVRMNAQPFVQAALRKGEVMTELASQAGQFAVQRYNMITEAQYNEGALEIDERMRAVTEQLSKTSDYGNIFDGENVWQEQMDAIKDSVLPGISNPGLRKKLEFSFNQTEIQERFRLQGVIDKKIIAAEQAALAARQTALVNDLSKPGATLEQYAAGMAAISNSMQNGIKAGRYNPDAVNTSLDQMKADIASGYLANIMSADPSASLDLFNLLTLQDEVASGAISQEDAMAATGVTDSYALTVLNSMPRDDALAVLSDNLKSSLQFFDANQKLEKAQDDSIDDVNGALYNRLFSISDDDVVYFNEIKRLYTDNGLEMPTSFMADFRERDRIGFFAKASDARAAILDILNKQMWMSPEQQDKASKIGEEDGYGFAPPNQGNDRVFSELYAKAEAGMLKASELNDVVVRAGLTASMVNQLRTKIFNEADESLNVGSRLIKRAFKYNEQQAIGVDDRLAQASKVAFEAADGALLDEFSRREAEGDPMTLSEIRAFAKDKVTEFDAIYREELRAEYEEAVGEFERTFRTQNLTVDRADPLGSVEEWFNNLDETQQERAQTKTAVFKATLKARYANQGLF